MDNKRSRKSTRSSKGQVEDEQKGVEEEEDKRVMGMGMGVDVDADADVDMDKPAKGGRQGKKEKKGGKAGKGKRAEEKQAEEKKVQIHLICFFFVNSIGFSRLPLEKNGPGPKSKAKKIWYFLILSI